MTGSSTTFSWTTGAGALQYWLYAGTTAGSNNLYSASQGTATSKTLTGLPTNGSNLYVRLWTRFASGWQYNDYVYKNSTVVNIKAAITSPTPGGTLTSSSTTFTWNTGSGALQYWLYVGTSAGANNVYSASQGTALSKTVTGIPLGGTIYVRLWTQFTTGWFYTDYSYSSGAKAVITSPSLGSTLAGSSQTFNWSTGSGAVAYWLYVGTSGYGSSNIVSAGTGLVTSKVVTGLPLTGVTVYARLWTYFSGTGWVYNDYWYKAASAAVMSSPTPGTTLTGSKVTFAWAAGGGSVNQYYIYVGTSLGNSNIYYSSAGTSLSHAVPGIPTTGITVYVRLWTRILTTWVYRDYAYKAATGVSAADMLNPVPGSAIGTSATFSWSTGTGVSVYYLYVGTTGVGSNNVYSAGTGSGRSRTVTGIPSSGTIYVRLWSWTGSTWIYHDYTYS